MTVPAATQPNIQPGLSNQIHIALNLFDTILRTANTREELERSWAAIEQDITAQEQLEARQQERRNPASSFLYRRLVNPLSTFCILFGCLDTVL
jgi:hypothetical protein